MTSHKPPRKVLLATDLSHRCDRALDRALQLARQWGATLLVVHAIENESEQLSEYRARDKLPLWRPGADPVTAVRERIYQDLAEEEDHDIVVHVEAGAPVEVILRAAKQHAADLIISGIAQSKSLSHFWLGTTVDRLVRKSPVPLLIVRDRSFGPYARVVVATDFSPSSRAAIETAAAYYPQANYHLLHGYDVPFAGYLSADEIKKFAAVGARAADKFLAEADLSGIAASDIDRIIERGAPAMLLRELARKLGRHLVVVGTHGGGVVYDVVIGSTAREIVDAVPADVLVVPDPDKRGSVAADIA